MFFLRHMNMIPTHNSSLSHRVYLDFVVICLFATGKTMFWSQAILMTTWLLLFMSSLSLFAALNGKRTWRCVICVHAKNKHQYTCYLFVPFVALLLLWIFKRMETWYIFHHFLAIDNVNWNSRKAAEMNTQTRPFSISFALIPSLETRQLYETFEFNRKLFRMKIPHFSHTKYSKLCRWHSHCPISHTQTLSPEKGGKKMNSKYFA